jgi:2-oxoglutarate ferredoxin oxidoreductase subunit alpha
LPGSEAAQYVAQGDEHNAEGSVDESAENAVAQMEKRMKKFEALRTEIPEPEYFGDKDPDLLLVSWGSNKSVIMDVLKSDALRPTPYARIGYLHYTYLWPLQTDLLEKLSEKAKTTAIIECNHQSQLAKIIRMESGLDIPNAILKYDGRPFFYDELIEAITSL